MKRSIIRQLALTFALLTTIGTQLKATVVDIPTKTGTYISWSNATGSNYEVENNGDNVGSTGKNTQLQFTINNTVQQDYTLTFALGSKYEAKMRVTLKSATGTILDKVVTIPNTGSWTPTEVHYFFLDQLPADKYTLSFRVTEASSYAGNWGKLAFYAGDGVPHAPGTVPIGSGSYDGGARTENNNDNVGWIVAGSTAKYNFICDEPGVYEITTMLQRYNQGGTINIKVEDITTGNTEVDGDYVVSPKASTSYVNTRIPLAGEMTRGLKKMTFTFRGGESFICNYKALNFKRVADHWSTAKGIGIEGLEVLAGTTTDWECILPKNYANNQVVFNLQAINGSLAVTAAQGGNPVTVTSLGNNTYSIETPEVKKETVITFTLTPDEGFYAEKKTFTLRIYQLGDIPSARATLSGSQNSRVVTLTFDREIEKATATFGNQTLTGGDGTNTVRFTIWDLDYNKDYTFTLTEATDHYGNTLEQPQSVKFTVGSKPAIEQKVYDYVVDNTDKLLKAISAVNSKGGTARKTIFLKNGIYAMPETSTLIKATNVSLIGQSREGVVILGTSKEDGQGSAIFKTEGNGLYLQDLTLRTSHWRTGEFYGRVLALNATNEKMVMKRVDLEGQQDTYLCGHRAYHEDCGVYGTVDFIYAGGDNFFQHCDIVIENRKGNVITAPSTSQAQRWGMVFNECTIKAAPNAPLVTNGSFSLGRPWHNEPRTYYLNTTMEVKPSDTGWAGMSTVPTHFYEYNSMDKNGKPIDLSRRGNSPSSTNSYKPVLTDEEATLYTARNVLGGNDAWDAAVLTRQLPAPQGLRIVGTELKWDAVEEARCYLVCKNGDYLACTTSTSLALGTVEEGAIYTVQCANLMGGLGDSSQCEGTAPSALKEKTPAFPGAEGYGRYVTGGRGGQVYHVTNLKDSGTGSLRWACEQSGTRTIVFDVSGTIHLKSQLKLRNGNVTIAGQTAPGDGICVADWDFTIAAPNVIIRYMRFRPGETSQGEPDGLGGFDGRDIIVDHCSVSWSVDECLSVYGNEHMTVQWCIVSQSLRNSTHAKSAHGYGGNWGGKGATYHHNLVAHHDSRTPRFGNRPTFVQQDTTDYRCNVIYNWAGNGCYGGEGMKINMVNNYYKPGPATDGRATGSRSPLAYRICGLGVTSKEGDGSYHIWGKYYVDGNENPDHPSLKTKNWEMGIYPQISTDNWGYTATTKDTMRLNEPLPFIYVTTHTPQQAYEQVLKYAGASLHRDAIDEVIISDTRQRKATYTGDTSKGDWPGIIDSPFDLKPNGAAAEWTPWPELSTTNAPLDTDGDGMPDDWETANGLNPNNKADGTFRNDEGYTNLELYMNAIVDHITQAQNEGGTPEGSIEYATEEDLTGAINIPTNELNPDKAEISIDKSGKQAAKVLNRSFDSFSNGDQATFLLNCKQSGIYTISLDAATTRSDFKLVIEITDVASGITEVDKTIAVINTGDWQKYKTYTFETGGMTEGTKRLTMTWLSTKGQYTGNVKNISLLLSNADGIQSVPTTLSPSSSIIYDLKGHTVPTLNKKGIYIRNGKKIVIR